MLNFSVVRCAGFFAHLFKFPLNCNARRTLPENPSKTRWRSEEATTACYLLPRNVLPAREHDWNMNRSGRFADVFDQGSGTGVIGVSVG
jgi:hypothetical protein